jgi:predicted nucleic acid-binding protein
VNNIPVVYIDTMVFVYRLLENPNYSSANINQSMRFFDDIDGGIYTGITSTFTQAEYIAIAKIVISYTNKRQVTSEEERTAIDDLQQLMKGLGINLINADMLLAHDIKQPPLFYSTLESVRMSTPYFDSNASEKMSIEEYWRCRLFINQPCLSELTHKGLLHLI